MLRSSRPQPGQKSSLVLNSLGLFAGFFGLLVGRACALMMSFSFLSSRSSSSTLDNQFLERRGERLGLLRRAAARDHRLPVLQVRIEGRLALEKRQPAIEELVIELLLLDDLGLLLLRLAGHLPRRLHVLRGLEGERARQLHALRCWCIRAASPASGRARLRAPSGRRRWPSVRAGIRGTRCSGTRRRASSSPWWGSGSYL